MHIRALNQFLSLADNLHFGRASEASNISTSALSRNIRHIEDELGAALFTRDNRSVELTPKGHEFYGYARDAVARWNNIRTQMNDPGAELKGNISVYCSVTASYSILFDLLNRFRPDYPGIDIKLHTGDPEDALNRVAAGDEDISIAAHPGSLPRGLAFKPITLSPLLFIAPREQSIPTVPETAPDKAEEWETIPMIVSEEGIARKRINAWFKAKGVSPHIYAQVAGNEAIVSMVSLGLGFGVVPELVLNTSPMSDRVKALSVKPALEPYNIGIFTRKLNLGNPLISAFWNLIDPQKTCIGTS